MSAQRRSLVRRLFSRPRVGEPGADSSTTSPLEILIAALLGLSAIATAFAAYQTELANGDVLKNFQEGAAVYDDANQQYNEGNQQYAHDTNLFLQYAIARSRKEDHVADYIYDNLMDPYMQKATDEWEDDPDTVASPLEAKAYHVEAYAKADAAVAEGDELFDKANEQDRIGDQYTLATVFLAMALFFGGVAGVSRSHAIQVSLASMTTVILIGTGIFMLTI
jgi:hypothetical protein